jgi:hypothetical protein
MRPLPVDHPPPIVVGYAPARIGPHRLEIDQPPKGGDRPPAMQDSDPLSQQAYAVKNSLLFEVNHVS